LLVFGALTAAARLHLDSTPPRHRTTFINVAVWESAQALARAFGSPEFQARTARYPDSAVAAPHLFEKVAVAGICVF